MTLWHRFLAWMRAHPQVNDAFWAIVVAALTIPSLWRHPTGPDAADYRDPNVIGFVLLCLASIPIAFRRRAPMAVLVTTFLGTVLYESVGFPTGNVPLGPMVALYTVAARCDRRRSSTALGLAAVGVTIVLFTARWEVNLATIISNSFVFVASYLVGETMKSRRAVVAALEDRAVQAEATRMEEAKRAVAEERTRIARELHDVVAHSMSVMIVQAGAARRVLAQHPDQAAESLASIESTGRGAMAEMRRLLGVLRDDRDDTAAMAPQPSVRDLESLLAACAEAGLPVSVEVDGQARDLPAGIDLSAYRIVQEALTNARKHAGPATAVVVLRYGDDALDIEVRDDGRGAAAGATDEGVDGSGHGLIGMRERVDLYGGDLEAGPRAGGGFTVRAHLPLASVPT